MNFYILCSYRGTLFKIQIDLYACAPSIPTSRWTIDMIYAIFSRKNVTIDISLVWRYFGPKSVFVEKKYFSKVCKKISKLLTKENDWRKRGLTCVAWYILCVKVEEGQGGNSVLDSNLLIFSWGQYLLWQVISCWLLRLILRWMSIVDIQLWDRPRWCS